MARLKVTGLDEMIRKVEAAGKQPEELVKRSLYEGAGLVADNLKAAVGAIPTGGKRQITSEQRAGLQSGIGISHMREENGSVSVVIGFNGQNPDGHKNTTIMRRVESGSSSTEKYPTVRPTARRSKAAAMAAMQKQFEEDIKELFE